MKGLRTIAAQNRWQRRLSYVLVCAVAMLLCMLLAWYGPLYYYIMVLSISSNYDSQTKAAERLVSIDQKSAIGYILGAIEGNIERTGSVDYTTAIAPAENENGSRVSYELMGLSMAIGDCGETVIPQLRAALDIYAKRKDPVSAIMLDNIGVIIMSIQSKSASNP